MKAPNGKDSNLPENFWLTVRTKAFKSWFGDWENDPQNASKVVDENGEPLVVYHGNNADFSIFEGQKIKNTSEGAGFYFTPNKNLAQGFGNIKATFLNIRNPQYAYGNIDLVSDTYEEDYEKENKEAIDKGLQEVKKKLEKKGYKFYKQVQKDLFDVIGTQTQEVLDGLLYLRNFVENENLDEEKIYNDIREAEKEVFKVDGYTTNRYGGDQKVYVAFTSNQIKSINNRGAFDNNNPDIYFQNGSPQVAPLSEQIKKKISDLEEQRVYENKYGQTIDLDKSLRVFKKEAEKYAVEERKSYLLDLLDNDKDKFIDEFGKSNIQEMLDDYNSDNEEQIESVQEALNNDDIRADIKNVIEDTTGYEIENSEQYHNLLRKYGNYIDNRINVLADILKEKGYKVKIDKSNMSESNYIYLPEQEVSIRLSEHTDRYDNDIDLRYSNSIEENIKNIEEYFQEKFYQDAYHGTPHIFDLFSTDNIGTGEGAQAHGWGLYFSKLKAIAEKYRRLLTSGNDVDFTSNKPISQEQKEYLKDLIDWTNVDNSNKDWYLKKLKNEIKYMQDMFTKTLNNAEQDKQTQTYLLNKLKEFDGEIEQFITEVCHFLEQKKTSKNNFSDGKKFF